jgi:hypothetical protein
MLFQGIRRLFASGRFLRRTLDLDLRLLTEPLAFSKIDSNLVSL